MADYRRKRLAGLRAAAAEAGADGFLLTGIHNVSYLTGFTGSSGFVLATGKDAVFITDFRYKEQAAQEVEGCEILIQKGRWTSDIAGLAKKLGIRKLGFESRHVSVETHAALETALEGVELAGVKDAVERLRMVKDEDEIARITEAVKRAEAGFVENMARVAPGMTEKDTALGLEFNIRSHGARKVPFDIIVASGPRAALPHGAATQKEMQAGETVVIDFGAEASGYQSDLTRSGVLGEPDGRQAEIYEIVLEAQARAIEAVRPGAACRDVDLAAREFIASKGYGENFGHGLGHGVGLEVHEAPSVSHQSEDVVAEGMVFTIEPGIYIPGWGGYRVEDMVLVTSDGCRVISSLEKDIKLYS